MIAAIRAYLMSCFTVLQTESHTPCHFAAFSRKRPQHGLESLSCSGTQFILACLLAFRLFCGITRVNRIVTLTDNVFETDEGC